MTGSKLDMDFFKDTRPWHLDGERVTVVDDNEHQGLIVSGLNEEQKNIDNNITQCRNSLFKLLGPALSYKCQLSPIVQLHLWKTYSLPVLRSGLSALPIRPATLKSLEVFQRKIFRGFLKLSNSSPVPSLFFLLGEVPIEASVHMDLLGLFYTILSNPQTKLWHTSWRWRIPNQQLGAVKSGSAVLSMGSQILYCSVIIHPCQIMIGKLLCAPE